MTSCTYLDKKQWMRWHVTQSALLDERNMKMLEKFYRAGPSSIKSSTSRGPGGIQTSSGVIDYISSDFVYPKICDTYGHPIHTGHQTSAGIPRSGSHSSDVSAHLEGGRPPYRKRTRYGVYVGRQPSHIVKQAVHPFQFNPDTTIPRDCTFYHCRLPRLRKMFPDM